MSRRKIKVIKTAGIESRDRLIIGGFVAVMAAVTLVGVIMVITG